MHGKWNDGTAHVSLLVKQQNPYYPLPTLSTNKTDASHQARNEREKKTQSGIFDRCRGIRATHPLPMCRSNRSSRREMRVSSKAIQKMIKQKQCKWYQSSMNAANPVPMQSRVESLRARPARR